MDGIKDLRQTQEWADYLGRIGWQVERVPDFLYIRKLPLLPWSIGKLQRAKHVNWELVSKIKKKHRIIKLITTETVAKKTIWIDLGKSESRLLNEMKPKTRYNIGLGQRRGITTKIVDGRSLTVDDEVRNNFFELIKQNARRLKIFAMPKKWWEAQVVAFGNKCFAVLALAKGQLVAGNFFMTSKDACFYSHNGSVDAGRKNMAPSACVWAGIKEAKKRKLKIFDFDGIDDGSLRAWRGFSRFKKGFGGKEVIFS